ncbi:hypothetical protein COCVIDRAFT_26163 [Bipolaris victoriae FI3]|uniref:Uncharacterized protein n=1 Tax=Bipolaris victoriae (strain FI3) TaxID=930091 RepID=W7EAX1_BIPV3|nr:hypothetical protein COCVIDRAFT_26163 [Bipolaris victoriae FI3]
MAPRTEHEPEKHHRINPGARDRQYLNAHTGAGVNKHRPVSGRGNNRASSAYQTSHRHTHVSSPDVRAVEHPKIHDDSNVTGKLHTQHYNTHLHLPNNTGPSSPTTTTTATPRPLTTKPPSTSIITNRNIIPVPRPPLLAKRRRCIDPVKRAFTNHNLRAIMADKPWPTQRKKASAEKMVLKMGMRREYK